MLKTTSWTKFCWLVIRYFVFNAPRSKQCVRFLLFFTFFFLILERKILALIYASRSRNRPKSTCPSSVVHRPVNTSYRITTE